MASSPRSGSPGPPATLDSPPLLPSFTIRRPASSDSIRQPASPSRHLRSSSSSSSLSLSSPRRLSSRSSLTNLRRPVASKQYSEPTLVELMKAEERELMRVEGRSRARRRRSSGIGLGVDRSTAEYDSSDDDERRTRDEWEGLWAEPPPESAVLHPPLYGRPGPSPSPDIFTTLLQPILSLSRPSSPGASPSLSSGFFGTPQATEEPADRSASSLPAHFPPRASSDPAPTVESQGFVLYLGSLVAWIIFLVWSLCTDDWLQWMGVEWYPSREWALLVPAWTIMLAAFVYYSYIALNIFITPPLDSLHTLTDHNAYLLPLPTPTEADDAPHPLLANSVCLPEDAVPPLHDLPIGLVNRVTFGDYRRKQGKGWGSKRKGLSGEGIARTHRAPSLNGKEGASD